MVALNEPNKWQNDDVFSNRSKEIDYERLDRLFLVGAYQRVLPVSLSRMMENAYDWEHLPHVHASSFKSIDLVEEGSWGWRAVATLPDLRQQHLELLVDRAQCYWATTVLSGDAKGFQIHSQATQMSNDQITVDVKFYLPQSFSKILTGLNISKVLFPFKVYASLAKKLGIQKVRREDSPKTSIVNALNEQYAILYDEDELLMTGRQAAIDRRLECRDFEEIDYLAIGTVEEVHQQIPKVVQFGKLRYVVNYWNKQWRVYGADCPHLLGPLENSEIDDQGCIRCPWHGYQFHIISGENCEGNSVPLAIPPIISIVDNQLVLTKV